MVAGVHIKRPRRRANAPGPGTEEQTLDARLIVARLTLSRPSAGRGSALGAPTWKEAGHVANDQPQQRDAIYELVVTHLTGIGDVWITLENRDIATSKRLAHAFVEDLHLLNDLGWDETIDSERVSLTVPPGELVRTLARLHRAAAATLATYVSRPRTRRPSPSATSQRRRLSRSS